MLLKKLMPILPLKALLGVEVMKLSVPPTVANSSHDHDHDRGNLLEISCREKNSSSL